MTKQLVMFTFTEEQIREPIIYNLGQQFNIVTNIHQAALSEDKGWVILEIEGEEEDIEAGITWVTSKGIKVDPVTGDIIEG